MTALAQQLPFDSCGHELDVLEVTIKVNTIELAAQTEVNYHRGFGASVSNRLHHGIEY